MKYLYIDPYVHINCMVNSSLFYNTLTKDSVILENNGLIDYIRELEKSRSVVINSGSNSTKAEKEFVQLIQAKYMGGILILKKGDDFPIIFDNNSKVKYNVDIYKEYEKNISEKSIDYLREITFFINNKCSSYSDINFWGYKQNFIPIHSKSEYTELPIERIEEILDEISIADLNQINILGGSIFDYSDIHKLIKVLNKTAFRINYFINFNDFIKEETQNLLNEYSLDNIVVVVDIITIINQPDFEKYFKRNITYSVYIQVEEHFEIVQRLKEIDSKLVLNIYPYFNGTNREFFKDNVFSNPKHYLERGINSKQIVKNKILNMIAFGKLYIMYDESTYSNLNHEKVCNSFNLKEIVEKEFTLNRSWLRTRKDVDPCNKCIYNQICPPISNYEYVLNQYDLCNRNIKVLLE